MKFEECRASDQSFTHIDDDGTVRVWNVSAAMRWCVKELKEIFTVDLSDKQARHLAKNNGVEEKHLLSLTDECLQYPILLFQFEDDRHLVVDGNHRAVYANRRGKKDVPAWILLPEEWKSFLIDIPDCTDMKSFGERMVGRVNK